MMDDAKLKALMESEGAWLVRARGELTPATTERCPSCREQGMIGCNGCPIHAACGGTCTFPEMLEYGAAHRDYLIERGRVGFGALAHARACVAAYEVALFLGRLVKAELERRVGVACRAPWTQKAGETDADLDTPCHVLPVGGIAGPPDCEAVITMTPVRLMRAALQFAGFPEEPGMVELVNSPKETRVELRWRRVKAGVAVAGRPPSAAGDPMTVEDRIDEGDIVGDPDVIHAAVQREGLRVVGTRLPKSASGTPPPAGGT